jgi:predicted nucleic acid-binding protein
MLIVDASCLYEVVADTARAEEVRARMSADPDQVAPHVIDAEVLGIVRRDHLLGRLDLTAARQAIDDLRDWPGERFGHRALVDRAWELRDRVRSWDALYVALAEALDGTLLTLDRRLGRIAGLRCSVEVLSEPGH